MKYYENFKNHPGGLRGCLRPADRLVRLIQKN